MRYLINSRGQIQMESKADMKRRLKRSPDRADMLAMLFDYGNNPSNWDPNDMPISPAAKLRAEMEGW